MTTVATRHRHSARRSLRRRRHCRQTLTIVVGAIAAAVLIAAIAWIAVGRIGTDDPATAASPWDGVPVDGTILGDPNAPATLVAYGDYYCPHCADFALQHEFRLVLDFVASGRMRYEFRPLPVLGGDLNDPANPSIRLAEASYAALAQGAWWPFHHAAFERTAAHRGTPLTDDDIIALAADTVPDPDRFRTDLANRTYRQQVLDTWNQGLAIGITGVPSFFLNDVPIPWTGDYDSFRTILEASMA